MTHDDSYRKTKNGAIFGSPEHPEPQESIPAEKSLLTLIEEHKRHGSSSAHVRSGDFRRQILESVSGGVGGDTEIDLYKTVIRLGGNGI